VWVGTGSGAHNWAVGGSGAWANVDGGRHRGAVGSGGVDLRQAEMARGSRATVGGGLGWRHDGRWWWRKGGRRVVVVQGRGRTTAAD
jgi:hypothetical protein